MPMARTKSKSIDEYLDGVSDEQRAALERLRRTIRTALPKAEEYITYGIPAFRLDGKPVVGFGVAGKDCSLYPMSGETVGALGDELHAYKTSKGTIRFAVDKPLPSSLVHKIIKLRLAENAEQAAARATALAEKAAKRKAARAGRAGGSGRKAP